MVDKSKLIAAAKDALALHTHFKRMKSRDGSVDECDRVLLNSFIVEHGGNLWSHCNVPNVKHFISDYDQNIGRGGYDKIFEALEALLSGINTQLDTFRKELANFMQLIK